MCLENHHDHYKGRAAPTPPTACRRSSAPTRRDFAAPCGVDWSARQVGPLAGEGRGLFVPDACQIGRVVADTHGEQRPEGCPNHSTASAHVSAPPAPLTSKLATRVRFPSPAPIRLTSGNGRHSRSWEGWPCGLRATRVHRSHPVSSPRGCSVRRRPTGRARSLHAGRSARPASIRGPSDASTRACSPRLRPRAGYRCVASRGSERAPARPCCVPGRRPPLLLG